MREVDVSKITDEVKRLCIETNRILPADLEETICKACKKCSINFYNVSNKIQ